MGLWLLVVCCQDIACARTSKKSRKPPGRLLRNHSLAVRTAGENSWQRVDDRAIRQPNSLRRNPPPIRRGKTIPIILRRLRNRHLELSLESDGVFPMSAETKASQDPSAHFLNAPLFEEAWLPSSVMPSPLHESRPVRAGNYTLRNRLSDPV